MEEREIDLRLIIYKTLKKWRNALVLGLVLALILAGASLVKDLGVAMNSQRMAELNAKYDEDVEDVAMQKAVIASQIDSLTTSISRQQEYNENSMLMKIDPYCEYVGKLTVYVNAGYQIVPELSYQSKDPTPSILAAYDSYMTCGEMYDSILSACSFVAGQKYLSEVLSSEVDSATSTIAVSVRCDSEEHANVILDNVVEFLAQKKDEVTKSVGKHELSVINRSVLQQVDLDLANVQKDNIQTIADKDAAVNELRLQSEGLSAGGNPSLQYESGTIAKRAIKKAVIGFVIGIVACFVWFCIKYVVTRKLSGDDFWKFAGIAFIGSVYGEKKHRSALGRGIDKLVRKVCGMGEDPDFADSCALVSAGVDALAARRDGESIALVGDVCKETAEAILAAPKASGRNVTFAGDTLCSADAVKALEGCGSVILVATEDVSDVDGIMQQLALFKSFGKEIIGAVSVK